MSVRHFWAEWDGVEDGVRAVFRVAFGDRVGVTVFLGALCFFSVHWTVGFSINDNFTLAHTMVAVSEGHLELTRLPYGGIRTQSAVTTAPGMHTHGGSLYGENYGQVFLALPFLWTIQAISVVADLRIAAAGTWSLLVLAFVLQLGRLFDRRREAALGGSALAVALFAANVVLATNLPGRWVFLLALHWQTMVAAALVGVLVYRLVGGVHDRRSGATAAGAVVLATPVGFWATFPMRHATTAALVLATVFLFYLSRTASSDRGALQFRALSYVPVGLTAWVFSLEGFVLLAALGPVDLLTARSNEPKRLATVGAALFASLIPFFATNALISGNPVRPPLFLAGNSGGSGVVVGGGIPNATVNGTGSPGSPGSSGSKGMIGTLVETLVASVATVLTEPEKLYHTFVRSSIEASDSRVNTGATNLSLLESMPLAALVVGLPAAAATRIRSGRVDEWLATPAGKTDLLVAVYAVLLTAVYVPFLPLHAQITVRYLVPVMPLLVYASVRLDGMRAVIHERPRTLVWTYGATVLVGGQLVVVSLVAVSPQLGEAMQFHALIALALAAVLVVWTLASTTGLLDSSRAGAVAIGVAAGATTVFVLLGRLHYYSYASDAVLPVARVVAETVANGIPL